MNILNHPAFKWFELIIIFAGVPILYYFDLIPFHKAIPLLVIFIVLLIILLRDSNFNRSKLGLNHFREWRPILLRFILFAIISGVIIYIIAPNYFLFLPRDRFLIWVIIMISYPLWSAFPQEFIYRTWFFHRYRSLFKSEVLFILINAFLFSFSHIIFRNWLAIVLTFAGGIMFALTYKKSRSLMAVFAEHVLYGNFIFTIGIGQYFYLPMGS